MEKGEEHPGEGNLNKLTNLAALLGATVVAAGGKKGIVLPHQNWFPHTILENYPYLLTPEQRRLLQVAMYGVTIDWETGDIRLHPEIPSVEVVCALPLIYDDLGAEKFGDYRLGELMPLLEIGDIQET